jgi:hypothetical protein
MATDYVCVLGETNVSDDKAFDVYHAGHRVGVAIAVPCKDQWEFEQGDVLALKRAPVSAVFVIEDVTKRPIPTITLDDINATHNRMRIKVPLALILRSGDASSTLIAPGGIKTIEMRGGKDQCFKKWQLISQVEVLVRIGVGAVVSLELLTCTILLNSIDLTKCQWNEIPSATLPSVYTLKCGHGSGRRFEISPRCKGVIWRCPSRHFNADFNSGVCKECKFSPLAAEYDFVLCGKGKTFLRCNLDNEFATELLKSDTPQTGDINRALVGKLSSWHTVLVRQSYPNIVGDRAMPVHTIIGAQ